MIETGVAYLGILLAFALMILFVVAIYAFVMDMARARGHSVLLWVSVSLFLNPFVVMVVLWLFVPILDERAEEQEQAHGI